MRTDGHEVCPPPALMFSCMEKLVPIRSKVHGEMIETCGRLCRRVGLPRSTGQIYGLLYLSSRPLSLDEIVEILRVSKGSASMGARQLVGLGAIRQTWVLGDRKDYFEVVEDLHEVLKRLFREHLKPRLEREAGRVNLMAEGWRKEHEEGILGKEEFKTGVERLKRLLKLQKDVGTMAALVARLG